MTLPDGSTTALSAGEVTLLHKLRVRRRCAGMDLDLNGRVAVVTGASKGIGLAVVRTLLEEGVRVVAVSRSAMPDLDGELVHVPVDLMDPDAPAEVIARAVEAFGGLDILVNTRPPPPSPPPPPPGKPVKRAFCVAEAAAGGLPV